MAQQSNVRLGNAGGYWGDDFGALKRQLSAGPLDFVSLDFLAEITMSILQKQRSRDPKAGYARDFVEQIADCLPLIEGSRTRIISNAGGINPGGCAREISERAEAAGASLPVAVVEGDDILDRLDELIGKGHALANMETGAPLSTIRESVESANAYLGAAPVIKALELGGRIIVTGRVTDTGISVAAPAHVFGWDLEDWDRLAAAVVAGHILECGSQASGGNLTDWREVPSFQNMSYPIAEFSEDGSFVVTKHPGLGGIVNRKTVSEQLVYEMGNPREYITPDVTADFSTISLEEVGPDRVRICGVQGRPRTDQLKISVSYKNGYKSQGTLIVSRPDAIEKCRRISEIVWDRLNLEFEENRADLIGYNACHQHLAPPVDPPEILLRLGVRDSDRSQVEEFSRLFASTILSTMPGVAIVGSRPRVQEVVAYWPCLLPADEIEAKVTLLGSREVSRIPWPGSPSRTDSSSREPVGAEESVAEAVAKPDRRVRVPLLKLAYARSGDKGDTCNIGIVARSDDIYAWMRRELTAGKVARFFGPICKGGVERFEVPNLRALNFMLHESLGGGGTVALGIDPQGKTYAHALLMMEVEIPEALVCTDR